MTENDVTEGAERELKEEVADQDTVDQSQAIEEQEAGEEASDFLLKWQERHQAYLAKKNQVEESSEETEFSQKVQQKKPSAANLIFKKKKLSPEMDQLPLQADSDTPAPQDKAEKSPIPRLAIWKSLPVFSTAFLLLLLSIYFISPLGKQKDLQVVGNQELEVDAILQDSLISDQDYVLTTLMNHSGHERNIEETNIWVKDARISFEFPNKFTITVEEYKQIGFVNRGEQYYSVLSNGSIADTGKTAEELPESYTMIALRDDELVATLVTQLAKVDSGITSAIQDVQLTPSKVTNDLLTLSMADGNTILVPLSEIDIKLPYYEKIAPQLQVASTVDMEAGIFSYASGY